MRRAAKVALGRGKGQRTRTGEKRGRARACCYSQVAIDRSSQAVWEVAAIGRYQGYKVQEANRLTV